MTLCIQHQILQSLRFDDTASGVLPVDDCSWQQGLRFADGAGLSLYLAARLKGSRVFESLSSSVQEEFDRRCHDNSTRVRIMSQEFAKFNSWLQSLGIRYLSLKGMLLYPDFVECLEHRAQYDYDFLVKHEDLARANSAFIHLGYSPLHSTRELVADHWPTLIKRTGWEWRGNYFDPEIPRGVELHFQLWDARFEGIPIRSLDGAWERSISRQFEGVTLPALCREDTLLYSVLHVFRHLLRNDLRLSHLYEIAFFLHTHRNDEAFWDAFLTLSRTCQTTQQLTATVFQLARHLFACKVAPELKASMCKHLPDSAKLWIQRFGDRGAIHCFRNDRKALLLHLSFLDSVSARWALLRKRLLPRHFPLPTYGVQTPRSQQNLRFHAARSLHYSGQLLERLVFQIKTLLGLSVELPRWFWSLRATRKR